MGRRENFTANIRFLRENRGFTVPYLAEQTDIDKRTLEKYFAGGIPEKHMATLLAFFKTAYGVTENELFGAPNREIGKIRPIAEPAAVTCPDGWAKITAGGGKSYSVCIEKTATSSTSAIGPAQIACLNKGASLCFANELYALCGQVAETGATIGATEEWFEAIDSKGASTAVSLGAQPSAQGYFSNCSASGSTTNAAAAARYRCCRR